MAPPRFSKVFRSHASSDSMLIPISYYDQLPRPLPKTVILQGSGGCFWTVAFKKKQNEVYFGLGWPIFVQDNSLTDGDFMTFEYNGNLIFEVSVYDRDGGCKETRAVAEEDKTIPRSKNKGKEVEVEEISDEDSDDSDYVEVKPKSTNLKTKGKSKVIQRRERVKTMVKNPMAYLDNPKNVHFETGVKKENNRSKLLVPAKPVKDYCLKFHKDIKYVDKMGEVVAETVTRKDGCVLIKKWNHICNRNNVKKNDRIVCEILRKEELVYAIKVHIIREKHLIALLA